MMATLIRMSRLMARRARDASPLHRPTSPLVLNHLWTAAWLGMCLGSVGCFYVKPIRQPMYNEPATIHIPLENPSTLVVRKTPFTLLLKVSDPDDDPITVDWPDLLDVDHTVEPSRDGEFWLFFVYVNEAQTLPSSYIRALVSDSHPDNDITVRWDLEIR